MKNILDMKKYSYLNKKHEPNLEYKEKRELLQKERVIKINTACNETNTP